MTTDRWGKRKPRPRPRRPGTPAPPTPRHPIPEVQWSAREVAELVSMFLEPRHEAEREVYRQDLVELAAVLQTEDSVSEILRKFGLMSEVDIQFLITTWTRSMREERVPWSIIARRISSLRSSWAIIRTLAMIMWTCVDP